MLTYFSEVVDSRFRIQDRQLVFENLFAEFNTDLLLKFVTFNNSQFSRLQKTRAHSKGINFFTFFKGAQTGYLFECVICKFDDRTSK